MQILFQSFFQECHIFIHIEIVAAGRHLVFLRDRVENDIIWLGIHVERFIMKYELILPRLLSTLPSSVVTQSFSSSTFLSSP